MWKATEVSTVLCAVIPQPPSPGVPCVQEARTATVKHLEQQVEAAVALVAQERREHEALVTSLESALRGAAKQVCGND